MSRKIGLMVVFAFVATMLLFTSTATAQDYPLLSDPPQVEQTGQNDAAVIVGIENYLFLTDIDGVTETVNDWEVFFERGLGISQVYTLFNERGTDDGIMEFAERAAEDVGEGGTLWFVFIGHGAPTGEGDDGVLVGVDAQASTRSLESRGVRRSELVETLEQGEQAQTMVVIDACFSGQSSTGEALAEGMQLVAPDPERVNMGFEPANSTVVMAAAEADQLAGPLPGMQRPAFSYVLLGALRGWASTDGEVTASEAIGYTRRKLRHLDHTQTPDFIGDDGAVLVRGAREEEPELSGVIRNALRGPEPERSRAVEEPREREPEVDEEADSRPEREKADSPEERDDGEAAASPGETERLYVGRSRTTGADDPRLRIYGFFSFSCPFSAKAAETLEEILADYDQVQLVFKNYPISLEASEPAARAALAAARQGKFWEMHDMLFARQHELESDGIFEELADDVGLSVSQFRTDFESSGVTRQIQIEKEEGSSIGVQGTPSFLIGDERLSGAQSADVFRRVIESQL